MYIFLCIGHVTSTKLIFDESCTDYVYVSVNYYGNTIGAVILQTMTFDRLNHSI